VVNGRPELGVELGPLRLKNPVLAASGTFGYAQEFAGFFDVASLGGIVTKTITLLPRSGNPPPRIVETPAGMLNAIGLQNVGVDAFVEGKLPYLARLDTAVIVSIMATSTADLAELAARLDLPGIDAVEVNLSCPNVSYASHVMFAHDPRLTAAAVAAVRAATRKPVIAKLGPDVPSIAEVGQAARDAGADVLSVMNTIPGMVIDLATRRPVLANRSGGLSGPAIRPVAVRLTYELSRHVDAPVIGIGGIGTANDALQFLLAGASAVQVGTASFLRPTAAVEVLVGLTEYVQAEQTSIDSLIGVAHD
jgi:dihydroorotate dehydrogenase (NAD+) catalytic subunit